MEFWQDLKKSQKITQKCSFLKSKVANLKRFIQSLKILKQFLKNEEYLLG